ncbi:MAG: prepilin peptidase [Xanthomonadales bacterium]|nr:A24 family peptidase [Desulfofustis sp.]NNL04402.1 prepilin peptidase [Xanthomonadales bacterium]
MELIFEMTPLLYAGVFIFGLLIGSFLNVLILRIPPLLEFEWRCQCNELLELQKDKEKRPPGIVAARSKCPKCGHGIRAWENIPIFSYLLLRGRCSSCQEKISPRYPLVELTTAVLFVITMWHFGLSIQGISGLVLVSFLITLTGIDFDRQLLPDNLTLPLLWSGILLANHDVHTDLSSSVFGAIAGYLVLWSIYHLFRLMTGKEGMGYGDFKLLAALGAWMGWQMLPLIILLSSVVGALTGLIMMSTGRLQKDQPLPFGPFIAAAGWISLIWGRELMDFYSRSQAFG